MKEAPGATTSAIVTGIGLLAAFVGLVRGLDLRPALVRGFVSAWAGFLVGAFVGVVFDVLFQWGGFVAVLGHATAAFAAFAAVGRFAGRSEPATDQTGDLGGVGDPARPG